MNKSQTCFGKVSKQPLREYFTEYEANDAAEYTKQNYGNDFIPYLCKKCTYWHLSPKNRQTPSKKCDQCSGGDGTSKGSYESKKDAKIRANILFDERGVSLDVYQCKHGGGWHLTKSQI